MYRVRKGPAGQRRHKNAQSFTDLSVQRDSGASFFDASGKHALSKAQSTGSEGKALARLFA